MCLFPHVLDSAGLESDNKSLSLALFSFTVSGADLSPPPPSSLMRDFR